METVLRAIGVDGLRRRGGFRPCCGGSGGHWISIARSSSISDIGVKRPEMGLRETIMGQLAAMQPPILGGCLCGRFTYVCRSAPVWSVNCHCRSCQALSGAPFVSAFSVPAQSFESNGDTVSYRRSAESGHEVVTTHCAACGSRVHAQSSGASHLMNVFASTLDDPSRFKPVSNVYLSEAAHWVEPPHTLISFPKMPHE